MMETYEVLAKKSGRWWAIRVPDVQGVHSQAPTLSGVPAMAREAIALALDVAEDSFEVDVRVELPAELEGLVRGSKERLAVAATAQAEAAALSRRAARALLEAGLSQRDAAKVLEVSPQRVNQLVH